jgi:GTP cyclohydrolase I
MPVKKDMTVVKIVHGKGYSQETARLAAENLRQRLAAAASRRTGVLLRATPRMAARRRAGVAEATARRPTVTAAPEYTWPRKLRISPFVTLYPVPSHYATVPLLAYLYETNHGKSLRFSIISAVGEDLTRPGLADTPETRRQSLPVSLQGYQDDLDTLVNNAIFPSDNDEMVIVKDIELYSLCEHHLLPFIGKCHVAYLPSARCWACPSCPHRRHVRPPPANPGKPDQADCRCRAAGDGCQGRGVTIEAKHMCMMMRGVEKQNSVMKSSVMLGRFRDSSQTRNEYLSLITH